MSDVGAQTTVDGITARPDYDYVPPDSFFTGDSVEATTVIDARDYGAIADASVNNRAAIQSAIDAAHAMGGGTVYLPAGVYGLGGHPSSNGSLILQSNVFLMGDGMGETVLRVVDGSTDRITGIVRTPHGEATTNYGIADLTLDGNRANTMGKVDAFYTGGTPGQTIADKDAYVLRVEAANSSGYGFDPHEQTHRLVIADSVAHHNGLDGFVADFLVDSVYENNLAYENDRHGFNIVTSTNDLLLTENVARDNGDSGIVVQRGSEDIPSPENIVIEGGEVFGNAKDGIRIQMSDHVLVAGVEIYDNGTYGIRLMGSSNITVRDNNLVDNSQAETGDHAAIQIRDDEDFDVSGVVFSGTNNLIVGNDIGWEDATPSRYGIEERSGDVGNNTFEANDIDGARNAEYRILSPDSEITYVGGKSADNFDGGPGNDIITSGSGADTIAGGSGDDFLSGDRSGDTLSGDAGNDTIYGRDGYDEIFGGSGNDWISGGKGADSVSAGEGDDIIYGNTGHDDLKGNAGDDVLYGNDGNDTLSGDAGMDELFGGKGTDTLSGGDGDDIISGNSGADVLFGGANNDSLSGNSGNDRLFGDGGSDTISGGSGTDIINGGAGDDVLTGNSGFDDFIITRDSGNDRITDFRVGQDDLDISAFEFEALSDLTAHATATQNGSLRIALDSTTSVTLDDISVNDLSDSDFIF